MLRVNLILTGMRCSGKSAIGRVLAKNLRRKFFDFDREIEKKAGATIPEIVEKFGWEKFRELETDVCREFSKLENCVFAPGGGALIFPQNLKFFQNGNAKIIFLNLPVKILAERIAKKSNRPSLTGENFVDELQQVWSERKEKYFAAADLIFTPKFHAPAQENAAGLQKEILKFL